jgi:hypothetical protein
MYLNNSSFWLQGTFDTNSTLMDNATIFGLTLMASRFVYIKKNNNSER